MEEIIHNHNEVISRNETVSNCYINSDRHGDHSLYRINLQQMKNFNWTYIAIVVLIVVVIALWIALVTNKPKPDMSLIKQNVALTDSLIKSKQNELDVYRKWNDQLNEELRRKDSLLLTNFQKNNKIIYEKIPAAVNALPANDLIGAVNNY